MTPIEELERQFRQIQENIVRKKDEIKYLEDALSIIEEKMFWLETAKDRKGNNAQA